MLKKMLGGKKNKMFANKIAIIVLFISFFKCYFSSIEGRKMLFPKRMRGIILTNMKARTREHLHNSEDRVLEPDGVYAALPLGHGRVDIDVA